MARTWSWRRVGRAVSWVAFAGLLACVAAVFTVLTVIPQATHGAALTVLTGSMTPTIPVGSVVVIRPVDARTLHVGDIATYQLSPSSHVLITHRVKAVQDHDGELSFVFKGDANRGPDNRVIPAGAIRGEVWFHVPLLGSLRDSMHETAWMSLLAAIGLLGYAGLQVTGGIRDRKHHVDMDGPRAGTLVTEELLLDAPMIVATLPTAHTWEHLGLTPRVAASAWSGLLLSENEDTFTIALVPPDRGVGESLAPLRSLAPHSVLLVDGAGKLTVTGRRLPLKSRETHRVEA